MIQGLTSFTLGGMLIRRCENLAINHCQSFCTCPVSWQKLDEGSEQFITNDYTAVPLPYPLTKDGACTSVYISATTCKSRDPPIKSTHYKVKFVHTVGALMVHKIAMFIIAYFPHKSRWWTKMQISTPSRKDIICHGYINKTTENSSLVIGQTIG